MTISLANILLATTALFGAASIFLQSRLRSREPEQRDLLIKSNPMRMNVKAILLVNGALAFTPHPYQYMSFAVLLLVIGVAMVAQHRTLLRLGADPVFVKCWSSTSALIFLAGTAFTGALYLGAL